MTSTDRGKIYAHVCTLVLTLQMTVHNICSTFPNLVAYFYLVFKVVILKEIIAICLSEFVYS